MGALDLQLGVKDEVTFATAVTVDRFYEYSEDAAPIVGKAARTEGNPLRTGSRGRRKSRAVPYFQHAEGTLKFDVMDVGFGFWLKHMLPNVATTGSGPYTHTATEGTTSQLYGKSFTAQLNYPFHPAGTTQAHTFSGGKIPKWTISNTVDEMLHLELDVWFAKQTTGTALATASYSSTALPYSWVGGVVSVGGSAFDVTDVEIEVTSTMNGDDRPQIRGNSDSKEPVPGALEVAVKLEADYDSLAQFNRVHSTSMSGMYAAFTAVWTNGTSSITVSIPDLRFDDFDFGGDAGALTQSLSAVGEKGSGELISIAYLTADATP